VDPELRALLRRLLPVYLPTILYTSGAAAIVPVTPLVKLRLGMTVPQVALLGTLAGVLAVIGPLPLGTVVHRVGERGALIAGAVVAIISIVGCIIASIPAAGGWQLWLFAGAILVMAGGDLIWDLGRQTYLADEVPAHLRARAMTLFGGIMRVGRIVGPLLGAGVIVLFGAPAAFVVHLVAACLSLVLVTRFVTPHVGRATDTTSDSPPPPTRRASMRPILLVGIAALILTAARTNRDLRLPLLGHHYGYHDSLISLVFAVSSVAELVLVLPAGSVMDRYGRAGGRPGALPRTDGRRVRDHPDRQHRGRLLPVRRAPGARERPGRGHQQDALRRRHASHRPSPLDGPVEQRLRSGWPRGAGDGHGDRVRVDGGHRELRHRVRSAWSEPCGQPGDYRGSCHGLDASLRQKGPALPQPVTSAACLP
jgi:MFS family permease